MSRNMMNGYPMYPYYGATRQQNELLRCTGASGAEQISLPPETTAAVFDDEQDRVYIVSNVGEITGRPKIRYLATCCCQEPTRIQLLIGAEGAAAGTVNLVSGCIVKLA